jgi:hypothetical protein
VKFKCGFVKTRLFTSCFGLCQCKFSILFLLVRHYSSHAFPPRHTAPTFQQKGRTWQKETHTKREVRNVAMGLFFFSTWYNHMEHGSKSRIERIKFLPTSPPSLASARRSSVFLAFSEAAAAAMALTTVAGLNASGLGKEEVSWYWKNDEDG